MSTSRPVETEASARPEREFTVAVFVVHDGAVLLHRHKKLDMWLPPGGHVEPGELPDAAAIRETKEEAGLDIVLVDTADDPRPAPPGPQRLCRPLGIQLEDIPPVTTPEPHHLSPSDCAALARHHQHIDLIYAAVPRDPVPPRLGGESAGLGLGWYALAACRCLGVSDEVIRWAEAACRAVEGERWPGAAVAR